MTEFTAHYTKQGHSIPICALQGVKVKAQYKNILISLIFYVYYITPIWKHTHKPKVCHNKYSTVQASLTKSFHENRFPQLANHCPCQKITLKISLATREIKNTTDASCHRVLSFPLFCSCHFVFPQSADSSSWQLSSSTSFSLKLPKMFLLQQGLDPLTRTPSLGKS